MRPSSTTATRTSAVFLALTRISPVRWTGACCGSSSRSSRGSASTFLRPRRLRPPSPARTSSAASGSSTSSGRSSSSPGMASIESADSSLGLWRRPPRLPRRRRFLPEPSSELASSTAGSRRSRSSVAPSPAPPSPAPRRDDRRLRERRVLRGPRPSSRTGAPSAGCACGAALSLGSSSQGSSPAARASSGASERPSATADCPPALRRRRRPPRLPRFLRFLPGSSVEERLEASASRVAPAGAVRSAPRSGPSAARPAFMFRVIECLVVKAPGPAQQSCARIQRTPHGRSAARARRRTWARTRAWSCFVRSRPAAADADKGHGLSRPVERSGAWSRRGGKRRVDP